MRNLGTYMLFLFIWGATLHCTEAANENLWGNKRPTDEKKQIVGDDYSSKRFLNMMNEAAQADEDDIRYVVKVSYLFIWFEWPFDSCCNDILMLFLVLAASSKKTSTFKLQGWGVDNTTKLSLSCQKTIWKSSISIVWRRYKKWRKEMKSYLWKKVSHIG